MTYKEYYQPNEMKGRPRHYECLKSAVLCSIDDHSAFYVDENKQVHTFFEGKQLIIEIHTNNEPTHKLKTYLK